MLFCNGFSILENFTYYFLQFYFYIAYILPNKVVMIGITITNNKVLVVTTFVAYSTSPFASLTKIGNTASAGAADCTINVFTSIADNSFNGKIIQAPLDNKGVRVNDITIELYTMMKWFYYHPEEVKRMGENARPIICERYEQQNVWKALLKFYNDL